ncbi:beta-galactosidase [Rhipicephalus sanguineus]|nr:beta-galactosidase [Rhipicephalus sanguineus]
MDAMFASRALILVAATACCLLATRARAEPVNLNRSFVVDYENDRFLKDGEPFRYVSGSIHYFRVPKPYWSDRLTKMKMAGLNAIQTYVEWSGHEPEPGQYNFEGNYDLLTFLETAKDLNLYVILRPGPYICGERDNGGLPYWLLRINPRMKYRSSDKTYLDAVDHWFDHLLPMLVPYLYKNGGPIITVQVENEYGLYDACDKAYMRHLVDKLQQHLGNDVVLFRTDTPWDKAYECDQVDDTLVTTDFGPTKCTVQHAYDEVKKAQPHGPFVVTEYYCGRQDVWSLIHDEVDKRSIVDTFEQIMSKYNGSVNFYMFHGGTNYGFANGNRPPPQLTSYDHGSPLSEAGDPTDLYYMIRNATAKFLPLPPGPVPVPARKMNLGSVPLTLSATLTEVMDWFRKRGYLKTARAEHPLTFEELGQAYGYVVYNATVSFRPKSPSVLTVAGIKDRGYVMTRVTRSVLSWDEKVFSVPVVTSEGEALTILVENQGRQNYGEANHDPKGITSEVTLGRTVMTNWTMEGVPLVRDEDIDHLGSFLSKHGHATGKGTHNQPPTFFYGTFALPQGQDPLDTYFDPTGWGKGVVLVNGFNLGRYWPSIGPQVTLYVPGSILRPYPQENTVIVFETELVPLDLPTVQFVDTPNIDGPIPDAAFERR